MSMEVIEFYQVGSGGDSSIVFDSIPQTYTDLLLKLSLRSDRSAEGVDELIIQYNTDTDGYSRQYLRGNGSNTSAQSAGGQDSAFIRADFGTTSNVFSITNIYIPRYTATVAKIAGVDSVSPDNGSYAIFDSIWYNAQSTTDAITKITLSPNNGTNFFQYSSACLYGILAGSDGTTTVA